MITIHLMFRAARCMTIFLLNGWNTPHTFQSPRLKWGENLAESCCQVQKAGRNLDLYFRSSTEENLKGMESFIRHLRPEGVIIRSSVDTPEQADELIAKASQWCGSHANRTT
jgi:hypothetical protein